MKHGVPWPTESRPLAPVLAEGRNVWCIREAQRVSVVIDAAAYFAAVREAMMQAQCRIMLIGWDFDARILLDRDNEPEGAPAKLGDFIL